MGWHSQRLDCHWPRERLPQDGCGDQLHPWQDLLRPVGPPDCPQTLWNTDHGKKASWPIANPSRSFLHQLLAPASSPSPSGPGIEAAGGAAGVAAIRRLSRGKLLAKF